MTLKKLQLNKYKQEIADLYNCRSQNYDENSRLKQICHNLLGYSQIARGQRVLDIGTGTGHIAIAASEIVGEQGSVIGIDISGDMLEQAQNKANLLKTSNIEFSLLDGEFLDYPINFFDHILCANTFPWLENKLATVNLWHGLLKSGGRIGIHLPADTAYIGGVLLRKVLAKHGVLLEATNKVGSKEKCQDLLANAGFQEIQIRTENYRFNRWV